MSTQPPNTTFVRDRRVATLLALDRDANRKQGHEMPMVITKLALRYVAIVTTAALLVGSHLAQAAIEQADEVVGSLKLADQCCQTVGENAGVHFLDASARPAGCRR